MEPSTHIRDPLYILVSNAKILAVPFIICSGRFGWLPPYRPLLPPERMETNTAVAQGGGRGLRGHRPLQSLAGVPALSVTSCQLKSQK